MKISYVLLLNNEPQGKDLLYNLFNYGAEDEIIVIDDNCNETYFNNFYKHPNFKVIKHTLGHSYSEHRNVAWEHCKGDYVFYLDADEVLSPYLLKNIKRILELLDPDLVWLPRLNVIEGQPQPLAWPDPQGRIIKNGIGLRWRKNLHEQIKVGSQTNQLFLAPHRDFAILHKKTLEQHNKTNAGYVAKYTPAENKGL